MKNFFPKNKVLRRAVFFFAFLSVFPIVYSFMLMNTSMQGIVKYYCMDLVCEQNSRIFSILVNEGDLVKKEDVLCELDDGLLQVEKEKIQSQILLFQINEKEKKNQVDKALEKYFSCKKAIEKDPSYTKDVENALSNLQECQTAHNFALSTLQIEEKKLQNIEMSIEKMRIKAPFDGVIVNCWKNEKNIIQEGERIITLQQCGRLWIEADIKEKAVSKIDLKNRVKIKFPTYPNIEAEGEVFFIGSYVQEKNKQKFIPIKISLSEDQITDLSKEIVFRPGMSVDISYK